MKKILSVLLVLCMMAGMLVGVVSAADPKQAVAILPGTDGKGGHRTFFFVVSEGETKYALTMDEGYATESGASASNYNLKWTYPAGGTPTLYLKGAYLYNKEGAAIGFGRRNYQGYTDIYGFDVILYTETDSEVFADHKDFEGSICGQPGLAFSNGGAATITGPGKLTCTSQSSHGISHSAFKDFIIKDANLVVKANMPSGWGVRPAIYKSNGNLIIDHSTLDLYAHTGPAIWNSELHGERIGEKYDITIKNGSKVKGVSDIYSTETSMCGTMGKVYIDASEVELISTGAEASKGIRCFQPKPVLSNVTAIGGKTQAKAETFNDKKNATTYYFKSTPTAGGGTTPEPTTPAPTTPVGGGNTPTPTTPVGGGNTPTPTTPVGGGNTPTPTTPVGGGDVVDPTVDGTVDPTTDGVVDPTTGNDAPTTGNDAPTAGNNNGGTSESKPADETTPKADDDTTEEKGGSNVVLYIVIAVVVAAAIAAGVFFFLKKKNGAADATEE